MTNLSNFAKHKNTSTDYRRAKKLRQNSTDGEQVLWSELRKISKTTGIQFRRQHPIHPYIADFVCLKARLIVEVDGLSHDTRLEKDKQRDEQLQKMEYEILRFTNEEVLKNSEGVVSVILNRVEEILKATANPSP